MMCPSYVHYHNEPLLFRLFPVELDIHVLGQKELHNVIVIH